MEDKLTKNALSWRGIDSADACPECGGKGTKAYGSTSLWGGGAGGQTVTSGQCNECWGSGKKSEKWADLRRLRDEREKYTLALKCMEAFLEKYDQRNCIVYYGPSLSWCKRHGTDHDGHNSHWKCPVRIAREILKKEVKDGK